MRVQDTRACRVLHIYFKSRIKSSRCRRGAIKRKNQHEINASTQLQIKHSKRQTTNKIKVEKQIKRK